MSFKPATTVILLAIGTVCGGTYILEGVSPLSDLQPEAIHAYNISKEVYHEFNRLHVITSTTEGSHMDGSLHYDGYAIDVRMGPSHGYSWKEMHRIRGRIAAKLGKDYDVIVETDPYHLHIEYDPK